MKYKPLSIGLASLCFALCLTGCGAEVDTSAVRAEYVGTWQLESYKAETGSMSAEVVDGYEQNHIYYTFVFLEDGSLSMDSLVFGDVTSASGSWAIKNDGAVSVNFNRSTYIASIDGEVLTMESDNPAETIVCTRLSESTEGGSITVEAEQTVSNNSYELTLSSAEWCNDVSSPNGVYHIGLTEGKTFFKVVGTMKNLGPSAMDLLNGNVKFEVLFDGEYKYEGDIIDSDDFSWSIDPLENANVIFYVKVDDGLEQRFSSATVKITPEANKPLAVTYECVFGI